MATEILVNDGGAPARILPFIAGGTLSGGQVVAMNGSKEVVACDTVTTSIVPLGVAFTDASSGNNCSVITGKGVVLNVFCSGTFDEGQIAIVGGGDNGCMIVGAGTDAPYGGVAIYIDDAAALSDTITLKQVLML